MTKIINNAVKDAELEGVVLTDEEVELIEKYASGQIAEEIFIKMAIELTNR